MGEWFAIGFTTLLAEAVDHHMFRWLPRSCKTNSALKTNNPNGRPEWVSLPKNQVLAGTKTLVCRKIDHVTFKLRQFWRRNCGLKPQHRLGEPGFTETQFLTIFPVHCCPMPGNQITKSGCRVLQSRELLRRSSKNCRVPNCSWLKIHIGFFIPISAGYPAW